MIWECPSYVLDVEAPINESSEYSLVGTAVHKCLELRLQDGIDPDFDDIAAQYGIPEKSVEICTLFDSGMDLWSICMPVLEGYQLHFEYFLGGSDIPGHADVIAINRETKHAVVLDWKSGFEKKNVFHQLMGYAYGVICEWDFVETVSVSAGWLSSGDFSTTETRNREELEHWYDRMWRRIKQAGDAYAPGDTCRFCPRKFECEARNAWHRAALSVFSEEIPEFGMADYYGEYQTAKKALDLYSKAVRDVVADDDLPLADGGSLRMITQQRREINPRRAMQILRGKLPKETLAGIFGISSTKLEAAWVERHSDIPKTRAKYDLWEYLEDNGAVRRWSMRKLHYKKPKKEKEK